tara:strand:- start:74336 stop:75994 length:1659 start_codon:yes stop_codon:yes gene_type:complete
MLVVCLANAAIAKSPVNIQLGKRLFEHQWTASNPKLGSDGLGPLFNANSCATCHHQGGNGGSGEARFNAVSIGIEKLSITGGGVTNETIEKMLRNFHPGFIQPGGGMLNTLPLAHHGGSDRFGDIRQRVREQIPVAFSSDGGPEDAIEARHATATPIRFQHSDGKREMSVLARLFQRNTPALFGAGLIDRVPERDMKAQFQAQKRHPEISGRPSTLTDGRIGKFGWRANIATLLDFNDQACANEVGLETRRKPQPTDPTLPHYRNPSPDITDDQIRAINAFVESLPPPSREFPNDSLARLEAERGETLFSSVGCAVCHVPNMGPAKGLYSDLLLHDMGYESYDLNHALPYIRRVIPATRYTMDVTRNVSGQQMTGGYYGPSEIIDVNKTSSQTFGDRQITENQRSGSRSNGFQFVAAKSPQTTLQIVNEKTETIGTDESETTSSVEASNGQILKTTTRTKSKVFAHHYLRIHIEPTKFQQEWRTPPLWGLRDSAPYMHDGRAETVLQAIAMHDGESAGTRDRFLNLSLADRNAILAFLDTLVASRNPSNEAF